MWMFHSRIFDRKTNHLHKRSLGIAYKDSASSSEEKTKLVKNNSPQKLLFTTEVETFHFT